MGGASGTRVDRRPTGLGTALFFGLYQSFLQAFFMALLFFIAGYFAAAAYDRKGFAPFVRDRLLRLGVPTLVYMLVIGPLTLGVRAEHVHAGGGTSGRVDVIERLGDRTLIYAMLGDGSTIVYGEPGDTGVSIGDRVALSFDGAAVHLFDATGRAYHAE